LGTLVARPACPEVTEVAQQQVHRASTVTAPTAQPARTFALYRRTDRPADGATIFA
jgi:hypothetical protein